MSVFLSKQQTNRAIDYTDLFFLPYLDSNETESIQKADPNQTPQDWVHRGTETDGAWK